MKKQIVIAGLSLLLISGCVTDKRDLSEMSQTVEATQDIHTAPELGTAVSGDYIIAGDNDDAAGSRLSRIVFDGNASNVLSGTGTWIAGGGTDVTLNASATTGGMSLSGQEISNRAATNAQTGYATAAQITAQEANTLKDTNATHTGDVAGATALTIQADAVEESMLKAVNEPTDEYALTYESTTGDFEWQSVGGSMTWPTVAGIPYWTSGTAWGGAYTLVTTIGDPGSDTNIPSEQAVREAFSSLAFNMSGAESNLLWDTGVNYLDHLYTLAIGSKEMAWTIYDATVDTATDQGEQAFVVPSSYVGFELQDFTCSVDDLNSAASGTTTVVLRRKRGGTDADMTSTGVTIAYNEYTASDETVDTANDDLALGDKIYVDINAITTAVQKGLSCSAVFRLP